MKNGRNTAGKFTSGNSGRPKGARNKKTLAIEAVSLQDGVAASYETIRKAWYKHRDEFNSELITKGLADIIR